MTNDQAIRAGTKAIIRRDIRAAREENRPGVLTLVKNGKSFQVPLDAKETRAVIEALDLHLSNTLQKYGVSEQ